MKRNDLVAWAGERKDLSVGGGERTCYLVFGGGGGDWGEEGLGGGGGGFLERTCLVFGGGGWGEEGLVGGGWGEDLFVFWRGGGGAGERNDSFLLLFLRGRGITLVLYGERNDLGGFCGLWRGMTLGVLGLGG